MAGFQPIAVALGGLDTILGVLVDNGGVDGGVTFALVTSATLGLVTSAILGLGVGTSVTLLGLEVTAASTTASDGEVDDKEAVGNLAGLDMIGGGIGDVGD